MKTENKQRLTLLPKKILEGTIIGIATSILLSLCTFLISLIKDYFNTKITIFISIDAFLITTCLIIIIYCFLHKKLKNLLLYILPLFLLSILLLPAILLLDHHLRQTPPGKIGLLLYDLDYPHIQDIFEKNLQNYPDNDIVIKRPNTKENNDINDNTQSLEQKRANAIKTGRKYNAQIIMWGWYKKDTAEAAQINFEILDTPEAQTEIDNTLQGQSINLPPKQIHTIELQTDLWKNARYISLFTIGLAEYQKKNYNKSINTFKKLLSEPPLQTAFIKQTIFYDYLGLSYYHNNQYHQALQTYNDLTILDKTNADAYYDKGVIYDKLGDTASAIAAYTKTTTLNKKHAASYNNIASIYKRQWNLPKAKENIAQAIRFDPKNAIYHANNSFIQIDNKQIFNEASKATLLNPQSSIAHFALATSLNSQEKFNPALKEINQAISLYSKEPGYYRLRAIIHTKQKKYTLSLADANQAIALNPHDPNGYSIRALIYYKQNDLESGLNDEHQVIKLFNPQNPGDYLTRAMSYINLKQYTLALADLNYILTVNPNNQIASTMQKQIQQLQNH
jgi:tetratricopeptide (TPR) repeat protein